MYIEIYKGGNVGDRVMTGVRVMTVRNNWVSAKPNTAGGVTRLS